MTDRTCRKCGLAKPCTEFYRTTPRTCKACHGAYMTARRLAKIDEIREKDKIRGKRPERRARMRGWTAKYEARNPEKAAAHRAVKNALRRGDLVRGPCEVCGNPKTDAHHDDHLKQLEVRWLCRVHHAAVPLNTAI